MAFLVQDSTEQIQNGLKREERSQRLLLCTLEPTTHLRKLIMFCGANIGSEERD